jgi:hypothetical protein
LRLLLLLLLLLLHLLHELLLLLNCRHLLSGWLLSLLLVRVLFADTRELVKIGTVAQSSS